MRAVGWHANSRHPCPASLPPPRRKQAAAAARKDAKLQYVVISEKWDK